VRFLGAVGAAFDDDDLGAVDQAIDQGDHAGGVGEDLLPLGEGAVGGDQRALVLIAARDQFEHQVGVSVGVRQVPDLVDRQELRTGIVVQAATQRGIAVQGSKVAEELARGGEQRGLTGDQRLMRDVLRQHGFPGAVLADQDDIGGILEEVERHQGLDGGAVAALRPVPVEVAERFEAADLRRLQPPLQTAAGPFLFLPVDQRREPGLGRHFAPVPEQAVQVQSAGAVAQAIGFTQRTPRAADVEVPEMSPVHLTLFTGQAAQPQIGLGSGTWPVAGNQVAEVIGAAAIATLAHHRIKAAGGQGWELLNGRYASICDGRGGGPGRGRPACASTGRTTLWWTCNWAAMVPMVHFSAW